VLFQPDSPGPSAAPPRAGTIWDFYLSAERYLDYDLGLPTLP
jgi:hypothetical protein